MTCLKCGHQIELLAAAGTGRLVCACGADFTYPDVRPTGIAPSEKLAERSRFKAFRAAGVVKNVGGFALGISLLGALFFPLGLVGAVLAIYCLTMLRGPVGRYSGRRWAIVALGVGVAVFVIEGTLLMSFFEQRRLRSMTSQQDGGSEDLKRLRRAERLFRATHDVYGDFKDFRFQPSAGRYTIYLGAAVDDEENRARFVFPAEREGEQVIDPLPGGLSPEVTADDFTAVAVANLDDDPALDVWLMTARGDPQHLADDIVLDAETVLEGVEPPPPEEQAEGEAKVEVGEPRAVQAPAVEPAPAAEPAPTPAPEPEPSGEVGAPAQPAPAGGPEVPGVPAVAPAVAPVQ